MKRRSVSMQLFWKRHVTVMMIFALAAAMAACAPATTSSETGGTVAALSPDRQDDSVRPAVTWIARDDSLAAWGSAAGPDGWVGCGQSYEPNKDMRGRIDFYDLEGDLAWSFRRPYSDSGSCYMTAAFLDNGRVAAGGRLIIGTSPEVALLTVLNEQGGVEWEKQLDYKADDRFGLSYASVVRSDDQIFAIASSTLYYEQLGVVEEPLVVACYTFDGELAWQKELLFGGYFWQPAACAAPDGGMYLSVSGSRYDQGQYTGEASWLIRLDASGGELWRKDLKSAAGTFSAASLDSDSNGNVVLAGSSTISASMPVPEPSPAEFHDRFRRLAGTNAALLCFDSSGSQLWRHDLNGEFGAVSRQVIWAGQRVFWLLKVNDDVVPPYIFMSVDHRVLSHDVLAVAESGSADLRIWQFGRDQSASQLISSIQGEQARVIGIEPFVDPPEWSEETFIPGE